MTVPFIDGGRTDAGADCWGMVKIVYARELGIDLPDYGDIGAKDILRIRRMMGRERETPTWVRVDRPQVFDVVGMRLPDGQSMGHVGIVASRGNVLHTERMSGPVVEDMRSATIRCRIVGYWRHASRCP